MSYTTSQIFVPKKEITPQIKEAVLETPVFTWDQAEKKQTSLKIAAVDEKPSIEEKLKEDGKMDMFSFLKDMRVFEQNSWTKILLPLYLAATDDELIIHGLPVYHELKSFDKFKQSDFSQRHDVLFAQLLSRRTESAAILFNLQANPAVEMYEVWLFDKGKLVDFKAYIEGDEKSSAGDFSDFSNWKGAFPKVTKGKWEKLTKTKPRYELFLNRRDEGRILETLGISRTDFYYDNQRDKFGENKFIVSINIEKVGEPAPSSRPQKLSDIDVSKIEEAFPELRPQTLPVKLLKLFINLIFFSTMTVSAFYGLGLLFLALTDYVQGKKDDLISALMFGGILLFFAFGLNIGRKNTLRKLRFS